MILDELLEFADADVLATAIATSLEGDVIDLGEKHRDPGNGEPLYLVIQVATTVTSAGAATVQFKLASDAQAAIAVDGTATEHFATKAFALADLVAGDVLAVVALPIEGNKYERFLGILSTVGTAALTGGAINAFLVRNPSAWQAYPSPSQGVFID